MSKSYTAPLALSIVLAAGLAACSGNPIGKTDDTTDTPVTNPVEQLPGTTNPSSSKSITRYEDKDEATGSGYAKDIDYDSASDKFTVDNLGFDADNSYHRGTAVATLAGYNVYEPDSLVYDPLTNKPIPQFQHRLIGKVSDSGRTEFALVRTGAYAGYGFGGFVLKRNGGVTLPTSGQARYDGKVASLRDFNGIAGLEYGTGDMVVAIDFKDFNDGDAVQGMVYNRHVYDMNGNDITSTLLAGMDTKYLGPSRTQLPVLVFDVGPGAIDSNGEIRGTLQSQVLDYTTGTGLPATVKFETGKYYGVVSGDNADELVGVIVVTSQDPRFENVTARETGGFILYRR